MSDAWIFESYQDQNSESMDWLTIREFFSNTCVHRASSKDSGGKDLSLKEHVNQVSSLKYTRNDLMEKRLINQIMNWNQSANPFPHK